MEFKFGAMNILELGQLISNKLNENGINEQSELIIYVNSNQFRKIDEDLFYRNNTNEKKEFIPSEGEIIVNFEGVRFLIKEKKLKN